jgi:hypothetical protein
VMGLTKTLRVCTNVRQTSSLVVMFALDIAEEKLAPSSPPSKNSNQMSAPTPKITVRKGDVFRFEKNQILCIDDDRLATKTVFLNSINEEEPLLVSWRQNWKDAFENVQFGPWNLGIVGKNYDNWKLAMSYNPKCAELQDENDASRLETVSICVK